MEESDQDSVEIINITFIIHTYISIIYVCIYINMIESYLISILQVCTYTYMCSEGETKSSGDGKEEKREGDKRITRKDLPEECIRVCRLFSIKWSNCLMR